MFQLCALCALYSPVFQDFIELMKLGEGGFGEVCKVHNRLDGQVQIYCKTSRVKA